MSVTRQPEGRAVVLVSPTLLEAWVESIGMKVIEWRYLGPSEYGAMYEAVVTGKTLAPSRDTVPPVPMVG